MFQNVMLSALEKGASEIHFHISSKGGSTDQGFATFNSIKSLPVPTAMHCLGNIESMAVIMYLSAKRRIIVTPR